MSIKNKFLFAKLGDEKLRVKFASDVMYIISCKENEEKIIDWVFQYVHKYKKLIRTVEFLYEHKMIPSLYINYANKLLKQQLKIYEEEMQDEEFYVSLNTMIKIQNYYCNGFGTGKKNIEKYLIYLDLCANKGDAKSNYILGKFYEKGLYVEKNWQLSLNYYIIAAYLGHMSAETLLYQIKNNTKSLKVYDKITYFIKFLYREKYIKNE